MNKGGYCPECGTWTDNVETRKYALFLLFILDCDKCKTKWDIQVRKE